MIITDSNGCVDHDIDSKIAQLRRHEKKFPHVKWLSKNRASLEDAKKILVNSEKRRKK